MRNLIQKLHTVLGNRPPAVRSKDSAKQRLKFLLIHDQVDREHFHTQGQTDAGYFLPDTTKTDYAEGFTPQLATAGILFLQVFEVGSLLP